MATRIARGLYEVSPLETITFTIDGPVEPLHASIDGDLVSVPLGMPFQITPTMLMGSGAVHFITLVLFIPDDSPGDGYTIVVEDVDKEVDRFAKSTADDAGVAKVQMLVRVS